MTKIAAQFASATDNERKNSHTFRNRKSRRPLITKDVETDRAVGIDVRVIDLGRERHLGWLKGVVGREHDREEEHPARIW